MPTIRTTKGEYIVDSLDEVEVCPVCGSTRLVRSPERGQITCMDCGAVIRIRMVDQGPEWRAFTNEEREKRSRVGAPVYPHLAIPSSVSATIDWRGKDATGKRLAPRQKMEAIRLRKWHRVSVSTALERNLFQAIDEIERLAGQLGLPPTVKDEALLIYRKAVERGLVKGRSINSVVAAALYAACRKLKVPITLDEFAKLSGADPHRRKEIARCYRLLVKEANIKVSVADPVNFVDRIMNILKLKPEIKLKALEIIEKAKELGLTAGKDPAGFAAAAVYIAALLHGERRTQKDVAKAAQVTEVTIRNRYKELVKALKISGLS